MSTNRRSNFKFKLVGFILLLVAIILFMQFGLKKTSKKSAQYQNSQVIPEVKVLSSSIDQSPPILSAYGRIKATNSAQWVAEVSGSVDPSSYNLQTGATFNKGDMLLKIVNEELLFSLLQTKSQFLNNLTQLLSDLTFDFPQRKTVWNDYLKAFTIQEPISPLPEVINMKERYFLNKRNIYQAYYNIKSLEARQAKYEFKAPYEGSVLESFVMPYGAIKNGQLLAQLIPKSGFECEVDFPIEDRNLIQLGNKVILSSMDSQKSWQGKIIRVSKGIRQTDYSIPVVVGSIENEEGIVHNQYVKITIQGDKIPGVVKLPKELIIPPNHIFIAKPKSKGGYIKKKKPIRIIHRSGNDVWIEGVSRTVKVLAKPYVGILENATINITSLNQ